MIVVDTQQLVYLTIEVPPFSEAATRVFQVDSGWSAPRLWESEFRSATLQYVRAGSLSVERAQEAFREVEELLSGRSFLVSTVEVFALAAGNRLPAYDLEFVALARNLRVPLVTSDRQVLRAFPDIAVRPETFVATA